MTLVLNLNNPDERQYFSCSPRAAAIAAHALSRHDGNSWMWEERYADLVTPTENGVTVGDYWATQVEGGA